MVSVFLLIIQCLHNGFPAEILCRRQRNMFSTSIRRVEAACSSIVSQSFFNRSF